MRDRFERTLDAWGHLLFRHARLAIAGVLVVVASLVPQLRNLQFDTSVEGFLRENDALMVEYDAFRERFGREDSVVIAIRPPAVFDLAFLEKLRAFHEELENEVPLLDEVTSLVNARYTRGEQDELVVGDLLEDWPESAAELAVVREHVLQNPLYRNLLISEDEQLTTVVIQLQAYADSTTEDEALAGFDEIEADTGLGEDGRRYLTAEENAAIIGAIRGVSERYKSPDFEIHQAGMPIMLDHLQGMMKRNMARFTLLAVLTIAGLLGLLFRHPAGVVLPIVIVVLSLLTTLSLMALSGVPLALPTQILPSFLLAVGVGASVHVMAIFYQRRRAGAGKEDAIAFALGHSGLPIVMTSLTTAGGLLSFSVADLAPIAHFGVFGPVGTLVALVYSIVLLPALVSVFPMRDRPDDAVRVPSRTQRLLAGMGVFGTTHAGAIVTVTAALIVAMLLGATQIRFAHNPLEWLPETDPFRHATEVINDELKGAMTVEVLIDTGRENGLHEPDVLRRMDDASRYADALQIGDLFVGKSLSLVNVVKEIHQALNENRPEFYALPDERQLVAQELLLFENSGSDDLEDVVDSRFSLARLSLKVPFLDAMQYEPFLGDLDESFDRILGEGLPYRVTGLLKIITGTLTAVVYSMAKSYLVAFVVITPLMILLIGSLRIGLLSMVPNLTPILVALGLMGWFDHPVDVFTMLVGSIAMGLAVDDTIHFMHNFRRYFAKSGDVDLAVRETLQSTGQAMLFTTLVLSTGFFIFMLADMENLIYFGMLTGFTILLAFLCDVVLAPALMALAMRRSAVRAPLMETST